MLGKITRETLRTLRNGSMRAYAERYVGLEEDFFEAVGEFGVPFAQAVPGEPGRSVAGIGEALPQVRICNDGKSAVLNGRSSACDVCQKGIGTETFVLTLQCPHRCFFCFNPNQADFDGHRAQARDVCGQLEERAVRGASYTHVALTGGEPLLYPDDAVAFVVRAKELFPGVHVRLYTSGFGATDEALGRLGDAGLDELRFSVKTDEGPEAVDRTLAVIAAAVGLIPDVLVEMPVMPDERDVMESLLKRLDAVGARGINLLELGFPFFNGDEFARRGYALKAEPFRVLYDYSYAGGLPVAGSEQLALDLMRFAAEEGLSLGVHYCSMENKQTGQIYHQNRPWADRFGLRRMSRRDYFLKSAKVFGDDRPSVESVLADRGIAFERVDDYEFTEFPIEAVEVLRDELPDVEVGISYAVCEPRDGEVVLRELKIDLAVPRTFDAKADW